MPPTPEDLQLYARLLNIFEQDSPETQYTPVYIYADGTNQRRQVTLARGFTSDGGNLQKVMADYIAHEGADAEYFQLHLKDSTPNMVGNKEFLKRLSAAGTEQIMQDAQDAVFHDVYIKPGLQWAETRGFVTRLSIAAVLDSYLHSGKMPVWLMNKFPEMTPFNDGDEKAWMKAYLRERLAWFVRATGPLHNTTYRPRFFLGEIAKGNWHLNCPLIANGTAVC